MQLPKTEHTARPWRIHEFSGDFRLEDVWALPTLGGPHDFPRLVQLLASLDPSRSSWAVCGLVAIRLKLGELLGWDRPGAGDGESEPTLRDRLPADLRNTADGATFAALPLTPLYLTDDECAAEVVNRTVHGVIHLGWVPDDCGAYRGQMAILMKRNGLLGAAYMAAITPFRYLIVYPGLLRQIQHDWAATATPPRKV